jgi:hypothetical protein
MHDSRVVEAGGPVEQWNQMVHELQEHHLALRATPEGRAGITRLVHHEVSTVRHWAATHALFWMSRSHVPSWNAKPAASQAPLSSKP